MFTIGAFFIFVPLSITKEKNINCGIVSVDCYPDSWICRKIYSLQICNSLDPSLYIRNYLINFISFSHIPYASAPALAAADCWDRQY